MVAIVLLHLTAAFTFGQQSASIQGTLRAVAFDAPAAGETKYYACRVGLHCRRGQVVAITGAMLPGTDHTFSDAPPPTPKPTTTLAKGGKADRDEDESDGAAALSLSLLAGVALFAV